MMVFCVNCKHSVNQSYGIGESLACKMSPITPEWDLVTGQRLNFLYNWCANLRGYDTCELYEEKDGPERY